jgi:hypothetical protein
MTGESNQALLLAASKAPFLLEVRPISMVGFFLLRKMRRVGNEKLGGGSVIESVMETMNVSHHQGSGSMSILLFREYVYSAFWVFNSLTFVTVLGYRHFDGLLTRTNYELLSEDDSVW